MMIRDLVCDNCDSTNEVVVMDESLETIHFVCSNCDCKTFYKPLGMGNVVKKTTKIPTK